MENKELSQSEMDKLLGGIDTSNFTSTSLSDAASELSLDPSLHSTPSEITSQNLGSSLSQIELPEYMQDSLEEGQTLNLKDLQNVQVSPGKVNMFELAFPTINLKQGVIKKMEPNLNLLMDVQMTLTVELGRTKMFIKEILGLGEGSIIELDKLAGEPVDLLVNGKLVAKGEVVVIDENFGVRVTDIVSPSERVKLETKEASLKIFVHMLTHSQSHIQKLQNFSRIHNFSPGPSTLPLDVLKNIQAELLDYKGHGMSIMEMSHRGKIFEELYEASLLALRELANIPSRFDILYMTGGASMQFALIPMNLHKKDSARGVGYVNTGVWATKAIEQAQLQRKKVQVLASSEDKNHSYIPKDFLIPSDLDYLHVTSNNTIFGTQFHSFPKLQEPKLIIDASSDFLSTPIDWSNIGMLYAGVQKNAGPSGLTIVIIDREYYKNESEDTPTLFRYSTFAKNQSMYNTPPTFQIYVFSLILNWIQERGGLQQMGEWNKKKAGLIYELFDLYPDFYIGHATKEDRSLMNITWNFKNQDLEKDFLEGAKKRKLDGLKGHRLVGGLRASTYNALPIEACECLADYMREFLEK